MTEKVAAILQCYYYYGDMIVEQRGKVLASFESASCGVLLATSALNHGYHTANIRRLFSFGTPENLMQYS
jgi:superfamily II DNA/RNA helicase